MATDSHLKPLRVSSILELKICCAQGREGLPQAEEAHLAEVLATLELVDLIARRRHLP